MSIPCRRRWLIAGFAAAMTVFLLSSGVASESGRRDWPQWRGPRRDGISAEKNLLKAWPPHGPPLLWTSPGAGDGYSSFSTANGRLVTMGARGDTEYVIAFDARTGRKLWEVANGRRFNSDKGDGPRGTPTVAGDRLYALGASGDLTALQVATGRKLWSVNVVAKFGGANIAWGLSESLLVVGDRVLVNAGAPRASIVALRLVDGSEIWRSQGDEAGYSSPVIQQIAGIDAAIVFTGRRLLGLNLQNGDLLWSFDRVSNPTANITTPIVLGNRVFVSSDGAALLEVSDGDGGLIAREVYFTNAIRNHHATFVLVNDHLFGFHGGPALTAMKFETGEIVWRDRSVGKGSVIYADDRLYLFSEDGVVGLAEVTPTGYREHGRFRIDAGSKKTWTHPAIANGALYLRDQDTIYAYDIRNK